MSERLFSLQEANALIPKLELIMGQLQQHGAVLREQIEAMAQTTGQPPESLTVDQILELRPELAAVIGRLESLLGELDACGGQLKAFDLGLVDFPTEIDGEVVLLCWQYGEQEISYYHSLDKGFADRKPLRQGPPQRRYLQ